MGAEKHATINSQVPERDLFAALVYVVQQGGYEIGGLSNELREVLFTSGKTLMSWGHIFAATVKAAGPGSVLQLSVAVVPGAPKALMDGRKNQKAAAKFIESVEAALAAPTPPQPAPVESFAMTQNGSTVPWTSGEFPGA
ncbi:MAG: hypothetical protein H0X12_03155 [Nocardioides sp.]|nr:hypothetical protein [Nocardioides sp.]